MSDLHWFVATVRSCQERKIAEKLSSLGIETFVPIQKVHRKWSDRIKLVDKLLIPGMVFIHCDEASRSAVFDRVYGVAFFLMDYSCSVRKPLVIPDKQMDDFQRVVLAYNGSDQLTVTSQGIAKGDMVRVLRGPLEGMVCECVEIQNQHKLIIRLGSVGSLLITIPATDVSKA